MDEKDGDSGSSKAPEPRDRSPDETEEKEEDSSSSKVREPRDRFARASWLFGRVLGLVFLSAFISFHVQLDGLIGSHGITPAAMVLEARRASGFWDTPTLAWFSVRATGCCTPSA